MKKVLALVAGLTLALFVTACGDGGKAVADAAIQAAEAAFAEVQSDALAYVPDQAKSVQDAITAVKDAFGKGNFQAALTDAQALTAKITELKDAAAAKKAELNTTWQTWAGGLPAVVTSIQAKMDEYGKKLPKGMTKEVYEGAKTSFGTVTQGWAAAEEAFKGGNLVDAVAKAGSLKANVSQLLTMLGMEIPEFLK
jgi:uncharacterized protein YoxC